MLSVSMFPNRRRRNDDRAGQLKVHLALGYTDMRKSTEGLAMLVQDTLKKDPFFGSFLRFPRWESPAYQHPFLGRERAVFVSQAARPRHIRVAADGGIRRHHYSFASATCDADRRDRLAFSRAHVETWDRRLKMPQNTNALR